MAIIVAGLIIIAAARATKRCNVRDYGAAGDNQTEDTQSLQRALEMRPRACVGSIRGHSNDSGLRPTRTSRDSRSDPIPVRASSRHSTPGEPFQQCVRRRDGGSERWRDCEVMGFCLTHLRGVFAADLARPATRPSFRRLRSSVSARQLFSARKCTHATTWAVKATLGVQCEARQGARDQKMAKDCGQGSALVIFCASSRARLDMARDGRGRRASRPALV